MLKPSYFIPSIIHQPDRSIPWSDWIEGSVLYADISGFTTIAEALAKSGAEGAEFLTGILNRFFNEMIGIVKMHGGHVMKFAGDSIFCCFPRNGSIDIAINAAIAMRNSMPKFSRLKTPAGMFGLRIKIGLSSGFMLIGVLKEEASGRCDILFAGPAVEMSAAAEKRANAGEILVAPRTATEGQNNVQASADADGYLKIDSTFTESSNLTIPPLPELNDDDYATQFLMADVSAMIKEAYPEMAGSLQPVVPVFVKFEGIGFAPENFNLQQTNEFFSFLTASAMQFDGNLNCLTIDDKGSNFLFYFGAPKPLERKEHAAIHWANRILSDIHRNFPDEVMIKAGMSMGRVYCGVAGGANRFTYTVVGDTVNLAARLMEGAESNQIWMTEEIVKRTQSAFRFVEIGKKEFKGKTKSSSIYSLDKAQLQIAQKDSPIAGREKELNYCAKLMADAKNGSPAMLILEGEPGTGKSFLAAAAMERAKQEGWKVLSGKSEITSRNYAYFPWLQLIEPLAPDLLKKLEQPGVGQTLASAHHKQESELQQFHHQIAVRILDELSDGPVFILFDELHWFDSVSIELLISFLNHLTSQRVFILAAARTGWTKKQFLNRSNCHFAAVEDLDRETAAEMIGNLLKAPGSSLLVDYVYDQCRGNPFLIAELIRYLVEGNHLLSVGGEWTLRKESIGQSFSGDEIVAARFRQMPAMERLHLQTAACMGPTFHIGVLKTTLSDRFNAKALDSLLSSGTFVQLEPDWITFAHGLVQEAVYHSIPARIRSKIHKSIAPVMESVLADKLPHYFPNLANHYRLARVNSKAIEYSIAAAKQLTAAGSSIEASNYWYTAYELTKRRNDPRKWDSGIALLRSWIRSGRFEESSQFARSLKLSAKKNGLLKTFYEASVLQVDAMRRCSDYSYLRFALRLLKDKTFIASTQYVHLLHLIGSTYFWLGNASKAQPYLDAAANQTTDYGTMDAVISANMFLAEIFADRENLSEAAEKMKNALHIAEKFGSAYHTMKIRHAWAGILSDKGQLDNARETFKELLSSAKQTGDFYMTGAVLTGLGQVETNAANWPKAEQYLSEAIRVFSAIGLPHGKAQATMWLGILSFHQNAFSDAYVHYKNATTFFEESEEYVEACHGYYNLAEVCSQLGRIDEAKQWYEKGIESFAAADNPQLKGMFDDLKGMLST